MRILILGIVLMVFCLQSHAQITSSAMDSTTQKIVTEEYELRIPVSQRGLLILFPCFPCDAHNTFTEFDISDISTDSGYAVLAMNFNQHLYLLESEKKKLAKILTEAIAEYDLVDDNVYIGGFSSGGNVSLLLADYLIGSESSVIPRGIFVVDSPLDLLALYQTAQKNIKLNFSETSTQEATWIVGFLTEQFGYPENGITEYEKHAPYTYQTQNIQNLQNLSKIKIRLYTEPDLAWWSEHRQNDYEDLNAYYIKKLSEKLRSEFGSENIELIETTDRGYRADGTRHPHSWSIVDKADLIQWMN